MDFKTFARIIDELKGISDRTIKAYKLDVDLIGYNNDFHTIINMLIEGLFTEESVNWIYWYMFEKDFGRDKEMKAWDKDKNEICKDIKGLYKLIKLKEHD